MLQFLKNIEPLLMLLLGWALGLVSPAIVERIRRGHRKRDLIAAVLDEMRTLQFLALRENS